MELGMRYFINLKKKKEVLHLRGVRFERSLNRSKLCDGGLL